MKNKKSFKISAIGIKASVRSMVMALLFVSVSACVTTNDSTLSTSKNSGAPKSDKALIHTQLARGYLQQKQYAVAKKSLDRALRIDPKHSDSNYVMGLLMLELKQYEDAEKYFARAIKSDPENSAAAHDFGVFLCQIGKEREGVESFEKAVANPLFSRAELSYMRAGECLSGIDNEQAQSYLKKALKKNPRLRPALYRLAVIKYKEKSYLSARAYIERYFAITKPQPAALLLAYQIESSLKATDVADKYRSQLLEGFPGSYEASSLRRSQRDK